MPVVLLSQASTRAFISYPSSICDGALIFYSVDVKALKTYQQLYIYFIPILANLGFVNILIVVVRLYWFEKRLKHAGNTSLARCAFTICERNTLTMYGTE